MNFTYKVSVLNQTSKYIRIYQIFLIKKQLNFDIFVVGIHIHRSVGLHLKINDFSIQLIPYKL